MPRPPGKTSKPKPPPLWSPAEKIWRVEFAERLRGFLAGAELRNKDVALSLSVSEQRVWNWVNGTACPSPYHITRLCRSYGVSADYLMLGAVSSPQAKWAAGLAAASSERRKAPREAAPIES